MMLEDMENIFDLVTGLVILAIIFYLNNRFFRRALKRSNQLPVKYLQSIINVLIISLGIFMVLSHFDFSKNAGSQILRSGTLIIAIATFAAQQTLGNVIAGFSLSMSHPIEIGHKVKIISSGTVVAEGIVTDISIRHVIIRQYDGQTVIVPNSVVDSSVIVNTNYIEEIGNYMEIEVSYNADTDKARVIIRRLLQEEETVIRKDVNIYTSRITQNGMVLKFTVWTKSIDDSYVACSHLREKIVQEFLKEGIKIPYQTITVYPIEQKQKEEETNVRD